MSKFIENHPSAIEVWLLYEGKKEKNGLYKRLCNLIGENGISKEDFKKLYKESKKKMRELVVNDPSNLRLCILSEVKNKKLMIESAFSITKMIGTQNIDCQDFEFWFNRFSSGNHDLDQKTFSDLPIEVLGNIVEKLDFLSQMKLRSVSHGLRNIVDQLFIQSGNLKLFWISVEDKPSESEIVETLGLSEYYFDEEEEYFFRRIDIPGSNDYVEVGLHESMIDFFKKLMNLIEENC
uniref:F-box domain-containing protein n=1 Tax=Caenorhabditis tropicalis TaxID=1561998 RepID=A0A1I7UI84_9PELO